MLAGNIAALLIVAAAIVLYATEKFPLSVTTILGMLAIKLYPRLWTVRKMETLIGGQVKKQGRTLKVDKTSN